jgi:hypothetical protein
MRSPHLPSVTKTTEDHYCRKRPEIAIREAQNIWMQRNSNLGAKTPRIDFRNEMPGYA